MNLYKSYGIYGIKNKLTGKIYVGKTAMNFGDRRDCHLATLRGGYHINPHLQRAWNKYGDENFEFIVIQECHDSDDINELEKKYIKEYKDLGLAYNISDGGDGGANLGKHLSEDTKRKIGDKNREHMLGRKLSAEVKQKMSSSQTKRYEEWTDEDRIEWGKKMAERSRGYTWSDEAKERFAERQRTRPNSAKYDIDTVHLIRKLHEEDRKTYSDISLELNIPRSAVYLIATYRRWKYA